MTADWSRSKKSLTRTNTDESAREQTSLLRLITRRSQVQILSPPTLSPPPSKPWSATTAGQGFRRSQARFYQDLTFVIAVRTGILASPNSCHQGAAGVAAGALVVTGGEIRRLSCRGAVGDGWAGRGSVSSVLLTVPARRVSSWRPSGRARSCRASGEAGARVDGRKKVGRFESGNRRCCDRLEP